MFNLPSPPQRKPGLIGSQPKTDWSSRVGKMYQVNEMKAASSAKFFWRHGRVVVDFIFCCFQTHQCQVPVSDLTHSLIISYCSAVSPKPSHLVPLAAKCINTYSVIILSVNKSKYSRKNKTTSQTE